MRRVVFILVGLGLLAAGVYLAPPFVPADPRRPVLPSADPVEAAWQEVHAHPEQAAAWVRLGEVQAAHDQVEAAEHAFRTAVRLGDGSGLAYARLGFLVYGQGRDAEAKALLLEAKRRGAVVPMLDFTLRALSRAPEDAGGGEPEPVAAPAARPVDAGVGLLDASAPPPAPEAICEVPLSRRGAGVFLLDLLVGGAKATLVVDTGASMTVVTEELAAALGARLEPERGIEAITANGRVRMPTAVIGPIVVADLAIDEARVAVCADCVQGLADGLLGLDLQATFQMELDLANRRIRLCP